MINKRHLSFNLIAKPYTFNQCNTKANQNQIFRITFQRRYLNLFSETSKSNEVNMPPPQQQGKQEDGTEKTSKSKVLRNVLLILALALTILVVLQPHNPFPSVVSKELRKGLWAERKHDYLKALTHYINALANYEQGEHKVNKLSDEYTGIELKIMEMYLNLNMYKEASMVLLELCYRYYNYLNDVTRNDQKVNFNTISRLYCRDLRAIIKFVDIQMQYENTGMSIDSIIKLLEGHLKLAESEVFTKDMEIPTNLLNDALKLQAVAVKEGDKGYKVIPRFENMITDDVLNTDSKGFLTIDLNSNRKSFIFEPFKDEIFIAKDLLDTLYLQKNDFGKAIVNKRTTLVMMASANCEPGMLMMTQANLGTVYYMRLQQLREEYNFFKANPNKFKEVLIDSNNFEEQYEKFLNNLEKNINIMIENTKECYNGIISISNDTKKKLKYNLKDNYIDSKIGEAISLSKYGMAVLNMNIFKEDLQSNVDLHYCKRLLNDSKALAAEIGFNDILKQIDVETKLVDNLLNNET
ncbi:hypothetical protein QEN19_002817 [Hanseniaspora menglaensis]